MSKEIKCCYCGSKDEYNPTTSGTDNCTNCRKQIYVDRIDGGPAFHVSNDADDEGMSLRDYFAGQALIGLLASETVEMHYVDGFNNKTRHEAVANEAYLTADAMLKEREK